MTSISIFLLKIKVEKFIGPRNFNRKSTIVDPFKKNNAVKKGCKKTHLYLFILNFFSTHRKTYSRGTDGNWETGKQIQLFSRYLEQAKQTTTVQLTMKTWTAVHQLLNWKTAVAVPAVVDPTSKDSTAFSALLLPQPRGHSRLCSWWSGRGDQPRQQNRSHQRVPRSWDNATLFLSMNTFDLKTNKVSY